MLGFLAVPSAKLKKVTHARSAYASAFSINILGRTSQAKGTQSMSKTTFAQQPGVKVQWGHLPLNPHKTTPPKACNTKIILQPHRLRTNPYSAPCFSTKPHASRRRKSSLISRKASTIFRSANAGYSHSSSKDISLMPNLVRSVSRILFFWSWLRNESLIRPKRVDGSPPRSSQNFLA